MNTDIQLKTALYNALKNDTALASLVSTRIYWMNPNTSASYPQIVYSFIDEDAGYALGCTTSNHRMHDVQVDTFVTIGNNTQLSQIAERIRIVLEGLGYQIRPGNAELMDNDIIQKVTRWRVYNV
jgi:hypothetical protein